MLDIELINSELSQLDEVMRDTAHSVDAGGTPFRPLFTVLWWRNWAPIRRMGGSVAGAAIELMHLGRLSRQSRG